MISKVAMEGVLSCRATNNLLTSWGASHKAVISGSSQKSSQRKNSQASNLLARSQHRSNPALRFVKSQAATRTDNELSSVVGVEQDIEGEVVLREVSWLGVQDKWAEITGNHIEITLISSDQLDEETGIGKTCGKPAYVQWNLLEGAHHGDTTFKINFKWNSSLGVPGAFVIKNRHPREIFLRRLSITIPGEGFLLFSCYSWVYPAKTDDSRRVFFSNKSFLPLDTPKGLVKLRECDLRELRGDGTGERKAQERIYDYDVYNDLGDVDGNTKLKRPILGGSSEYPYPRRCRTGRRKAKADPAYETRGEYPLFIPPDERFPVEDLTDFRSHTFMAVATAIVPGIASLIEPEFGTIQEIEKIYEKGVKHPLNSMKKAGQRSPFPLVRALVKFMEDIPLLRFQRPQILNCNDLAWRTDHEFARQTLAGINPLAIQCLQEFPPTSRLDPKQYGPQRSTISTKHIEPFLGGLTLNQAIRAKKLFIVDYYDVFMPYVERINNLSKDSNKTYATRTVFHLNDEGTLLPIAIEVCLPPEQGKEAFRQVYTAEKEGTEAGALWLLAKAHARSNDSGYHQLVSHWLRTHCITEPFILATNRQLSRMHPLHKLLLPHYLDTMDINQAARQYLINAGGIIEQTFTPGKYSMEMSAKAYKSWKFTEQALPVDLIKRGMAIPDPSAPHGLKLVIEDYPYAVDGLEIWSAIKQWVTDYLSLHYKDDAGVKNDSELQSWWQEIVKVGHADLQHDPTAFQKLHSIPNLIEALTTIIWSASGHHSAVNFGQYSYGGYMPNLPTMTRRLIPQIGSAEYKELLKDPDGYFLKTVSAPLHTMIVTAVLEILSSHATNEVYIGQIEGSTPDWSNDRGVQEAFNKFTTTLVEAEKKVILRNQDSSLPNRCGPAAVPYTLLYPNTTDLSRKGGVTGQGVPNSISI